MKRQDRKELKLLLLEKQNIANLTQQEKRKWISILVKERLPILQEFFEGRDKETESWLNCMGYGYTYTYLENTFNGSIDHKISAQSNEQRLKRKIAKEI